MGEWTVRIVHLGAEQVEERCCLWVQTLFQKAGRKGQQSHQLGVP